MNKVALIIIAAFSTTAFAQEPITELVATQAAAKCFNWPDHIVQATKKLETEPRDTHEPSFNFPQSVLVSITSSGACTVISTDRFVSTAPAFALPPHGIIHVGEPTKGAQIYVMFSGGRDGEGNYLFTGMDGEAGKNLLVSQQPEQVLTFNYPKPRRK